MRTLDGPSKGHFTQSDGLRIDAPKGRAALDGSALVVGEFVSLAVAVKGVTQARADGRGHPQRDLRHSGAAAALPEFVMNWTGIGRALWEQQWANI